MSVCGIRGPCLLKKWQGSGATFAIRFAHRYAEEPADEYTTTPIYPPILDLSKKAVKRRELEEYCEKVRQVETVEEKAIKINMPRYYGWKSYILNDDIHLQSLPFYQHITRTYLKIVSSLPEIYSQYEDVASSLATRLRPHIEEALVYEFNGIKRNLIFSPKTKLIEKDRIDSLNVIQQINRIILNDLTPDFPHLQETEVYNEPRHEAFWFAGNFYDRRPIEKTNADKNYDKSFQYFGKPALTLRNPLPLEPLLSFYDESNIDLDVPCYKYDPVSVGIYREQLHAANIPGFWPGDSCEFGNLSFHTRHHLTTKQSLDDDTIKDILFSQGILNSFTWLNALATYQGFSTYNDVTYPFVTQTVITNGQYWSFCVYQLNTMVFHSVDLLTNNKRNMCYHTEPLKLFEGFDENGKIIGFNEDVLKILIQLYLNVPKVRENIEMKPYLGKNVKKLADIEDSEKREWLEKCYKHILSHRGRSRLHYEIYDWEWIYKIKFKTRPLDARRRFFETFKKLPHLRTLDEHCPAYIPKIERKPGREKEKFERTYYP